MPNWSSNILILEGNKKELEQFYIENLSSEVIDSKQVKLSFNKSVTRPKKEEDNWYKWNCNNWGTKWDACYVSFEKKKKIYKDDIINTLLVLNRKLDRKVEPIIPIVKKCFTYYEYVYNFDTAWGPPLKWLEQVCIKYDSIKFEIEYSVEGFDNGGKIIIQNGDILDNEEWSVSEKVYSDNKLDIDKIVTDYINSREIDFSKLNDKEKESNISDISNECWEEGYYIGMDQIEIALKSLFKN